LIDSSNISQLVSRIVLITGASSGIGYETALAFARRGDKVAATARRVDRLEQLAAAAKSLPGEIATFAADVTIVDDMQRVVEEIMVKWGRLDVLVANAGIGHRSPIVDMPWEDLEAVLLTNINGVLHSVRAAVPAMRKSGGGQIITISSVTSIGITPYATAYAASKAALNGFARGLRVELKKDNIWVTNVLLGQTHSEFAAVRRGKQGRVAGKLPTMKPEYVARRIVGEVGKRHRTVTLRLIDHVINFAGTFFPSIMDRILEMVYKTK
jgi:3-oxoacyl-[acyl-carrier protein] reductase